MGNRANMVVVENGDWTLYDAHWVGDRALDVVAFGPEYAVRYIRAYDEWSDVGWTDPASASGGVLVDLDRRRMLFFGEELAATMNERRAILDVLPSLWPGYQIGWAYGGTDEMVAYLGAQIAWDRGRPGIKLHRVYNQSDLCHVLSVVHPEHGLRLMPLTWGYSAAWQGSSLVDVLPYKGATKMRRTRIPESGVHIDVEKRAVGAWTTSEARGLFDLMPALWAGWRTECWDDRYEEQVARCGGALRVPALDPAGGLATVRHWLHQRVYGACEDKPRGAGDDWNKTRDPNAPERDWYDCDYAVDSPRRPTTDDWNRFAAACETQRLLYTKSA
jgi:hypothetical protein